MSRHPDLKALMRLLWTVHTYRLSGRELVERTGISRATINRLIAYARDLGVDIVAHKIKPAGSYYEIHDWGVFSRKRTLDFAERISDKFV